MHFTLNLLLLQGPQSRKFPPSQLFFFFLGGGVEGEQPKVTRSQVVTLGRLGQNLDVFLLYEGHSDLGFVGLGLLWDFFFFFFRHS